MPAPALSHGHPDDAPSERLACLSVPLGELDADAPRNYTSVHLDLRDSSMAIHRDAATQAVLDKLLDEHGFAAETRLYREAVRDSLTPSDTPGAYRLPANANPSEAVVDVYGHGYLVQADQVGPGLAFAESALPDWQETMEMRALKAGRDKLGASPLDRVEVAVRLQDVLRQGGLIYPVESVTVERVWYCTLPAGSVEVREVT